MTRAHLVRAFIKVMMSQNRFAACLHRCARAFDGRRVCADHRHLRAAGDVHLAERPAGRGDPGSPHAGRDADDLVQGRLRRRDARQIGARAFPRTSDVQGHREASGRRVLADRAEDRRQRERLHLERLHRLFPAHSARAVAADDGVRGRPHDRPHPQGRERAARARRRARGIQHAGRQQSRGAAERADHGRALSQPSLSAPGDRLAPGDREARPRGRARLLSPLLCAQQRDPGDRGRHRRQGSASAGREEFRQVSRRSPRSRRAASARRSRSRSRRAR